MLAGTGSGDDAHSGIGVGLGVFELILRALADRPEAVADLDRLVQRLQATDQGRAVLPDGFDALWPVVMAAQGKLSKAGTAVSRAVFDAAPVLAGLKGFQRDTVEHVVDRFYGRDPTRRFLVADQTGLGKTLVARGVIARAIEALDHEKSVKRIDIVYVCSNSEIAQQNISRLDVTGDPHLPFASRLTLLAKHSRQLTHAGGRFTKPVNLISFTPGTSFEMGWQTGKAEERALLFLLLEQFTDITNGFRRRAALNLLRGQVSQHDRFLAIVKQLERDLAGDIDTTVAQAFRKVAQRQGLLREFTGLVDEMGRRQTVPEELRSATRTLTGRMRAQLARVSVRTLEPDLVILDEFQRFRHLLDEGTEAGELAHHLFDYGQARVLLLSATPYKPFTFAEEGDDDHYRDFLQTLTFLANGCGGVDTTRVTADLESYRQAAITGKSVGPLTESLHSQLLRVMCRTERPGAGAGGMLNELATPAAPLGGDDLLGYVALRDVARAVKGQASIDYWKSAPYFINFCDGYQLGDRINDAVADSDKWARLKPLLRRTQHLDRRALRDFERLDYGNARLRRLAADTIEVGWWQLLWVPPSLPYLTPGGPYAKPFAAAVTKRLVFSSWAATPTAVASLLSYEADRQIAADSRLTENTPAARRRIATRLAYSLDRERPQAMTTLALFWPMPGLAKLADPLRIAREAGGSVDNAAAERIVAKNIAAELPSGDVRPGAGSEAWYWTAALRWQDSLPADVVDERDLARRALSGGSDDEDETDDPRGLSAHIERALETRRTDTQPAGAPPRDLADTVAALALHRRGSRRGFPCAVRHPQTAVRSGQPGGNNARAEALSER
jgi:hypothetical protein